MSKLPSHTEARPDRPLGSLSLDLDNLWTYLRTHGDRGWESFPSYLDVVVPRVLGFLEARQLTITFFVVGQDAELPANRRALRAIATAGHEIGNHSFRHEPWFHLYAEDEIDAELALAEDRIGNATGERPQGFRGPGFSLSNATLRVLRSRRYRYDATTFPSFIGPLARAYYFMSARLDTEARERRRLLFGSFSDGRRPLHPYRWRLGDTTLIELPVTTMPFLRLPIHVSYLLCLSMGSERLARRYLEVALRLCRARGVQPSLLLHPLDFLGGDDTRALDFFPAMRLPGAVKTERVGRFVDIFRRQVSACTTGAHAAALDAGALPVVEPRFGPPEPRRGAQPRGPRQPCGPRQPRGPRGPRQPSARSRASRAPTR